MSIRIGNHRCGENLFFALCLCLCCFSLVDALLAQEKQAAKDDFSDAPTIELTVINSTGDKIPDAKIFVVCRFEDSQYYGKYEQDLTTDSQGIAKIKLLPTLEKIGIFASVKDHVTLRGDFNSKNDIPNEDKKITFQLQRSKSIGGKVVDSQGNPVSEATVEVRRDDGGDKLDTNDFTQLHTWITGENALKTDENGEWSTNQWIPKGDDLELSFKVRHPDFLDGHNWRPMAEKGVTLKQLKDRAATFTFAEKGVRVQGLVVDDSGEPVKNALVVWGDRPYWQQGSQEIKTDQRGEFNIPAQKPDRLNVTIVAKGWMPQLRKIDLSKPISLQKFELAKGKKLHLRFVDSKGKPVPKVRVKLESWRGIESLYNISHPNVKDSKIPRTSDKNGEFKWDWAPDDEIKIQAAGGGVGRYSTRRVTADDTIQTIVLKPPFTFSGRVVDATTKEPIDQFTITPVICYSGRKGTAQYNRQSFESSNFEMNVGTFGYHDGNVKFEVESLNYRVKVTEEFSSDADPFDGVILMESVPPPTGKVVDQNGKSIADASIFVCTEENGAMIHNVEEYFETEQLRFYKSAKDGIFQYPAQASRVAIAVASPDGYAEKYLGSDEHPGEVVIKPWATVRGKLFQEGKPVPYTYVSVRPIRALGNGNPHLQDAFGAKTDENGSFLIEKVPPVPCTVSSQLSPWDDYPITSNRSVSVRLEPGKTCEVNLGGEGIQVVGKVKMIGDDTDHIEFRWGLNTLLKVGSRIELEDHLVDHAKFLVGKQDEEMMKLSDNRGSTVGYETHFVKIKPDGSFLINGVTPGDYRFLFQMYEPPSG